MTSLGGRIGQCVERWRAEDRLRESDARKTAILNAAFDCIITMDADGLVVEVNQATERMFGYAASEMVGRELAELIVPPSLREQHRHGVARYVATGAGTLLGHPVELPAMRADGSEFPVEIAITQPQVDGPPQFTGFIRDVTHRRRDELALRSLAEEQAALRRVATAVASEADQERLFARRDRGGGPAARRELLQHPALRARRDGRRRGRAGARAASQAVPVGTHEALDGPTVGDADPAHRPPGAGRQLRGHGGLDRRDAARARVPLGRRRADHAVGPALGRGDDLERGGGGVSGRRRAARRRLRRARRAGTRQRGGARRRWPRRAPASSRPATPSGGASSATCTTARSSGSSRCRSSCAWPTEKLAEGDSGARQLLEQANAELADALQELRELARGIHPAILSDRGLGPALEMLARAGQPAGRAVHRAGEPAAAARSRRPPTTSWPRR